MTRVKASRQTNKNGEIFMDGKQIAETTLMYLGGTGRLSAMIGAKNFSHDGNGTLSFMFKMFKKANVVRFVLDASDTYTMKLEKYNSRTHDISEYKTIDGLYFDQLKEVFEQETGLYLTL